LILDEAHLAPTETLEETRVLSNSLGRPEGFAALVLVGQSALARRLELRSLAGLEARLAGRVHLRPIDADEAREWLARRGGAPMDRATVVELHRAAGGNPRRLLLLAATIRPIPTGAGGAAEPAPPPVTEAPLVAPPDLARLGTSRPPLHVEEGVVEVGWDPAAETEPVAPIVTDAPPPGPDAVPVAVEDHYAALQAWEEWSRNQGRGAAETARPEPDARPGAAAEEAGPASAVAAHPNLRAEGQQTFAPYSQLFSRLRQSGDRGS
jgi:general secretion pathway protein A